MLKFIIVPEQTTIEEAIVENNNSTTTATSVVVTATGTTTANVQPIIIQMAAHPSNAVIHHQQAGSSTFFHHHPTTIPTVIPLQTATIRPLGAPVSVMPPNKLPLPRNTSTSATGKLCRGHTGHITYRYIDLSMFFLLKLLEPAEQPMAGSSSSDGKILEGDNFQNYGGKDQCIYM